jgi:hypothetical protein
MPKSSRTFTPDALRASLETRQGRADARATKLAPLIAKLRARGVTSMNRIAAALNGAACRRHRAEVIGEHSRSREC